MACRGSLSVVQAIEPARGKDEKVCYCVPLIDTQQANLDGLGCGAFLGCNCFFSLQYNPFFRGSGKSLVTQAFKGALSTWKLGGQ